MPTEVGEERKKNKQDLKRRDSDAVRLSQAMWEMPCSIHSVLTGVETRMRRAQNRGGKLLEDRKDLQKYLAVRGSVKTMQTNNSNIFELFWDPQLVSPEAHYITHLKLPEKRPLNQESFSTVFP